MLTQASVIDARPLAERDHEPMRMVPLKNLPAGAFSNVQTKPETLMAPASKADATALVNRIRLGLGGRFPLPRLREYANDRGYSQLCFAYRRLRGVGYQPAVELIKICQVRMDTRTDAYAVLTVAVGDETKAISVVVALDDDQWKLAGCRLL